MRRARPERRLEAHLEEQRIAPDGAALLIACSGGPDSVALASLLARAAPAHRWRVVLAHVNHHLRPSSWQDECVVLSVAARLAVSVRIAALDGTARDEATMRQRRYAALAQAARDEGAAVVVTAHTAEDQSETVLLALFRGTGLEGLAGMPPRRTLEEGIELVRPLLRISREELHGELGASALPYVRDPSNADPAFRRNALRIALGALREEFPRLDEAVARCAAIVSEELAGEDRSAARRRLRAALAGEVGLRDVPFERIEAALAAQRGRVHIKDGVELVIGEHGADSRVIRRTD
ncbi:MAG: tRNA lysidine(34) synthetase TilS [Candidatus Eremiobacteraeota bacterium]|nr:tRNA lysidine(34) synthetase TilS [Candidatus Eremiobacteraeota bacterium]